MEDCTPPPPVSYDSRVQRTLPFGPCFFGDLINWVPNGASDEPSCSVLKILLFAGDGGRGQSLTCGQARPS